MGVRLLLILIAWSLAFVAPARAEPREYPWMLVGVSSDRRALLIHGSNTTRPVASLLSMDDKTVAIQFTADPPDDNMSPGAIGGPTPRLGVVSLPYRLAGHEITGPQRAVWPLDLIDWNVWRHRPGQRRPKRTMRAPSLVGLRVGDAREIAGALGISGKRITIRGPRTGLVSEQSPRASGHIGLTTGKLRLTTRSVP